MEVLNIVFAGTPAFAADHLQALLGSRHRVVAVYTQPDRAAGRGKHLHASPVKTLACAHGLPVLQPVSLKNEQEQQRLSALKPDLMIVVAYGLILPQAILDTPRFGCINVHASLLPRWRGAAPIERAILAGDAETGVTIMQMDAGLDTGAMLLKATTSIEADDDRLSIEAKLAAIGRQSLLECLDNLQALRSQAQQQEDQLSTYARKVDKNEALIDWSKSAAEINRQIRAGIGRNPAYSFLSAERIRMLRATVEFQSPPAAPGTIVAADRDCLHIACADSVLSVSHLQMPGKNVLPVSDVLNSRKALFAPGQRFSDEDSSVSGAGSLLL
jgi:methionyl-tRNA formyltransferase